MARVVVDGHGRLREFSAVPYAGGDDLKQPVEPDAIFRAAGLDRTAFTETAPVSLPRTPADQLRAWKGNHPALPNTEMTVEIGTWKGRATFVKVRFPWDKPVEAGPAPTSLATNLLRNGTFYGLVIGLFFAVLLAQRNWKLERADRKGALRLAGVRFLLAFLAWVGTVHALPENDMWALFYQGVGAWLLSAGLLWMLYLALEPELRARWPHSIVTWNRLLAGRWKDAQVGAHILIGGTVGLLIWVSASLVEMGFGDRNSLGAEGGLDITLGAREWLAVHAATLGGLLPVGLVLFLGVLGVKLLVRRDVPAALLAAALAVPFNFQGQVAEHWQVIVPIFFALFAILIFVLLRLGLVALCSAIFFLNSCGRIVVGADWTTWYAPYGLATLVLLLGIALFAFWCSLGSRELLGSSAAELG